MRLAVLAHALSSDLLPAFDAARRGGFDGVVLDPVVMPAIRETSQTGRREIVHHLERSGQTLVGIDVRLDPTGFSPRGDVQREIDRVGRAMDIARGLRSSLVLCDLGLLPPAAEDVAPLKPEISPAALGKLILPDPPKPVAPPPALPREEAFETSLDLALHALGERADRAGCRVAFRASLGSFPALSRALRSVDCPYFGVDLDPIALLADAWDADAIFSALGSSIFHVRGRDGLKGAGRIVTTPIGAGQVDWRVLLSNLRDADYDAFVTMDTIDLADRRTAAINGAKAIRSSTT